MSESTDVPVTFRQVIYELASGGGVLIRDPASRPPTPLPARLRPIKQLPS
jgi:hypothetical protein